MIISHRIDKIVILPNLNSKNIAKGSTLGDIRRDGEFVKNKKRDIPKLENNEEKERALYRLNKKKIRSKILAWRQVLRSDIKMTFCTVSFPKGLSDDDIKKIFNVWLTKLRKSTTQFEYIWIAERQKNGTLHFHVLFSRFWNIAVINRHMAKTIDYYLSKHIRANINFDINKYNGVDIRVISSTVSLAKYVTKYVTKNDTEIRGCVWNCSSAISKLYTTAYLPIEFIRKIYQLCDNVFEFKYQFRDSLTSYRGKVFSIKDSAFAPFSSIIKNLNHGIIN